MSQTSLYQLTPARERGLLWLLALTQFTIIMDFMVMMPLGPQIMAKFAIGPAAFATAVSAYAWWSGLSSLFAATYIDRFDRRKFCAAAPTFALLLVARAFAGLTGGVLGSIIMAILGDVIPQNRRGAATGIIMTSTTFAAATALFVVSWFGSIQMLMDISAVLLIGLVADVLNTWLTNAAILKWYVQKGGGK